jgi:Tfp pilus assembly protein PilO
LLPDFKKEKNQKITTIILTLLASIILAVFAVGPTLSTIVKLQKELDDDKFIQQKLQEKINNLSILQQKYTSIQNDLPFVFNAIPKSSQIPLLIAQLQGLANETNVKIINFQTFPVGVSDTVVLSKKFSSFDYEVTVGGDYQSMLNFLDKISKFSRILTINGILISKNVGINTSTLQLTVKGSAYFKK